MPAQALSSVSCLSVWISLVEAKSFGARLFARDLQENFVPSLDGVRVLVSRQSLLGIPALESVVFARAAVAVFFREQLLAFRTDHEIDEQKRRVRMRGVQESAQGAGVGGHQIAGKPGDRSASGGSHSHVTVDGRKRERHLAGNDQFIQAERGQPILLDVLAS